MPAPSIIPHTWPRNSAREIHATYDDNSVVPTVPLSTGTVTLTIRDSAGSVIGGGAFNGTHLGSGEWEINVPALVQVAGTLGEFTLTASKGGNNDDYVWWVKFVDVAPPLSP